MKKAIIIGGGPAGLTAALEFLNYTDIKPIVIDDSDSWGGISKTINYKGNRIDLGGHRFFSKSDKVMKWWLDILPIADATEEELILTYQNKNKQIIVDSTSVDSTKSDLVMLLRNRKSRMYYKGKFINYPVTINFDTIRKLGLLYTIGIGMSYFKSILFPIKNEENLEHFFINRFGKKLYKTFFKSYTEKVWGMECSQISAEWGAQRIKGLSIAKSILHYIKRIIGLNSKKLSQKKTETSLIEKFLYPKYGPGQLWEEVANQIKSKGGILIQNNRVDKINIVDDKIVSVQTSDVNTGETKLWEGDYFLSSMPVKNLINAFTKNVAYEIKMISDGLLYRDFITVGLLVSKFKIGEIKDNWIYIQDTNVRLGRLQLFNNWSPYMIDDPTKQWIGLEYFCNEGDELWNLKEEDMKQLAINEVVKIGVIDQKDVIDGVVIKVPKAYPAYFGTYCHFDHLKKYLNSFENLFLIGRNGMHKYNNQDHSMLTAMAAVDHIKNNIIDKSAIWEINTEQDYHEEHDEK